MRQTILYQQEDIIKIVHEHLKTEGYTVDDVKFLVGNSYVGFGLSERVEPTFTGIECQVTKNKKSIGD